MKYLDQLTNFDENNLPSLDEVVMWALELFEKEVPSKINISDFKRPLITGSWNAIVTARNIFSKIDALFCDETNLDECLEKDIDGLIICSSSWDKHAIVSANKAKEKGIKAKLLTCNPNAWALKILWKDNTVITKKNREPYTYNTSTYLWWILAITWEQAVDIRKFIESEIDEKLKEIDFSSYKTILMVTPDKFSWINEFFLRKFFELFWRQISRDVFSFEQIKHAITVIPCEKELAISFWEWDFHFKWTRINFPLPENADLWTMMAIGYYVIWKIQNSHPQYYKENINTYINEMNETSFWKGLNIIVE